MGRGWSVGANIGETEFRVGQENLLQVEVQVGTRTFFLQRLRSFLFNGFKEYLC